jgi:hypothetical protein
MAWENIKENTKTSDKESLALHELKQHKQRFDEECLGFLDQRKRAKMQWVQAPSQSNVDNINSVRRGCSEKFSASIIDSNTIGKFFLQVSTSVISIHARLQVILSSSLFSTAV